MALSMKTVQQGLVAGAQRPATRVPVRGGRVATQALPGKMAGNFMPGNTPPAYLTEIPGSYGFDPLELGKEAGTLQRFREAELIHARWAMLGAAGCMGVEVLGFGNWYDATLWPSNGSTPTWFGAEVPFDVPTIVGVFVFSFAVVEGLRQNNLDQEKRLYPGGAFDPLGFSKDPKKFETNKLKELKNGRLAMLACLGFVGQHQANGFGPMEALSKHLENPAVANFSTSGAIPYAGL